MRWRRSYWRRNFGRNFRRNFGGSYGLAWLIAVLTLLLMDTRSGLSSKQKDEIINQALRLSKQWLKKRLFKMIIFCLWILLVMFIFGVLFMGSKELNSLMVNFVISPFSKFVSTEYTKTYFWIVVWLLISYVLYVLTIIIWKLTSDFRYELANNEFGYVFYLNDEPSEKFTWKDVIPDFKKFLRFSIAFIIVLIMFAFGLLFFIIPGLVLFSKLIFFGIRIIYRDEGIFKSISNSIEITTGFGSYILLPILLIIVLIPFSVFLLFVGFIFATIIGFSYILISIGYIHRVLEVAYYVRTNQLDKLQKLC